MGPKFVIVFSGVEEVSTEQFLKDLKQEIEELALVEEYDEEEERKAALLYLQKQLGRSRKEENESVAKDK